MRRSSVARRWKRKIIATTRGNWEALKDAVDTASQENQDVSAETPLPARRADALERVAEDNLTGDETARNGGDRCTLHVHTDIDTLRADGEGAQAEIATGGNVSAETSSR